MTPFINEYSLNDQTLNLSDQHTYLGVTIHKHLSWTPHITSVVAKASSKNSEFFETQFI